ncbi:MAG: hypothetical protein PHG74_11335 [Kiritimatiellae bacterium]|nr:hypothetical protein [Kiritimatiellia bacterium]
MTLPVGFMLNCGPTELFLMLLIVSPFLFVVINRKRELKKLGTMICSNCGTIGVPKIACKGSLGIEILLWLMFVIPGAIYTVWRLTTRGKFCQSCGAENMVPLNSPIGKKLQKEIYQNSNVDN